MNALYSHTVSTEVEANFLSFLSFFRYKDIEAINSVGGACSGQQ
mgnify:FL=1